jgi:hypothetical protein
MNTQPEILLAASYGDIDVAKKAASLLKKGGIVANVTTCAIRLSSVIGVVLTSQTEQSKLLKENPWIEKEFQRSDETRLRVLPFILYDSKKESLDAIWKNHIEEIYEAIFSDEFKPLAYDLSNPEMGNAELLRLLQLYYVK